MSNKTDITLEILFEWVNTFGGDIIAYGPKWPKEVELDIIKQVTDEYNEYLLEDPIDCKNIIEVKLDSKFWNISQIETKMIEMLAKSLKKYQCHVEDFDELKEIVNQ